MVQVGSVVRVPRPSSTTKLTTRATVATVDEKDASVSILMHDSAPQPLVAGSNFIVTPTFAPLENDEELTVEQNKIMALLEFEQEQEVTTEMNLSIDKVSVYKEHGDALFRLGDASAAIPWYEAALVASSMLQVGSVVIVLKGGRALLCDVDCIEDDTVDVTLLSTDEEMTISKSQVVLCLMNQAFDNFQERILLNLARCLLQLASLPDSTTQNRPMQYRKAVVLACTLAFEMDKHQSDKEINSAKIQESALVLRARAQAGRHQYKNAQQDVRKLLKVNPHNAEGLKLQKSIQKQQTQHAKSNKKLAKAVCAWVDKASSTESGNKDDAKGSSVSDSDTILHEETTDDDNPNIAIMTSNAFKQRCILLVQLVVPLLAAWIWYAFTASPKSTS